MMRTVMAKQDEVFQKLSAHTAAIEKLATAIAQSGNSTALAKITVRTLKFYTTKFFP